MTDTETMTFLSDWETADGTPIAIQLSRKMVEIMKVRALKIAQIQFDTMAIDTAPEAIEKLREIGFLNQIAARHFDRWIDKAGEETANKAARQAKREAAKATRADHEARRIEWLAEIDGAAP
jgi:predicted negative regulator of RcsB-dependent stress response